MSCIKTKKYSDHEDLRVKAYTRYTMNSSMAIVLLGSFVFHMSMFSGFPAANLSNDAANISLLFFSGQCTCALSSEWGSPVGLGLQKE